MLNSAYDSTILQQYNIENFLYITAIKDNRKTDWGTQSNWMRETSRDIKQVIADHFFFERLMFTGH